LVTEVDVPFDFIQLWKRILDTICAGVVVIAAGGNGQTAFPAMVPEVIAVGGVAVDTSDNLTAWSGASSFASAIFKGRNVPDLCGLAPDMWLPVPVKSGDAWIPDTGTSFAAPQISGIAALLLQKTPGLTPDKVLTAITDSARDITKGTTAFGDKAGKGRDLATGAGLVSARSAWDSV
jgi:subtilisin family serine protease